MIPEGLCSQVGQDLFAYEVCGPKGTFLDVGAGHPTERSNTYWLEKEHGWVGLLVENNANACEMLHSSRIGNVIYADCTKIDYLPIRYDYLSLDADSASLDALRKLLADGVTFRCATIEHDRYRFGDDSAYRMRHLLRNYFCVFQDVKSDGMPFEDWYVGPLTNFLDIAKHVTGPLPNRY